MPSYVVSGASRGLGFEFIRQLSEDPENTVVGLVRNTKSAKERFAKELSRANIHILYGDLDNYDSLKTAAAETSRITDGKLDYLIANAAIMGDHDFVNIGELGQEPEALEKELLGTFQTNAIGNIHLINVFMPLILQGSAKKVIALSTGLGDIDLIRNHDIWMGVAYSISKAALNMVIAKFSAQYREEGILFLGISPGVVNTTDTSDWPESTVKVMLEMGSKFAVYAPHWKGPISASESVGLVLPIIEKANVKEGDGGNFVSHLGNRQWL